MSEPRLHPSADLLVDLARGALAPGEALVVGAHISVCPHCAASVRLAEAVGGALLAELPPTEMAPDALAQALSRLDAPREPFPPSPPPPAPSDWISVPPEVLAAARTKRRQAAPGVWVAHLARDRRGGARSYLLGVGAGIAVPLHTHRGRELICVLKGAYEDGGRVYGPGDFAENDESIEHRPTTTRDGECVCLIAADHRLVPRNLVARLLQPLVGI